MFDDGLLEQLIEVVVVRRAGRSSPAGFVLQLALAVAHGSKK